MQCGRREVKKGMGIATLIDRAIATVAPQKGLQRAAARQKIKSVFLMVVFRWYLI